MTTIAPPNQDLTDRAAQLLYESTRVLFITGAGLSADSGLPTYRGVGGIYNHGNTEEGLPIEVALSGPIFASDPGMTWKYIMQIETAGRHATHNRGHDVIAALEARPELEVWTLTQNVDGFHADAGSTNLINIHGDLHHLHCTACDWTTRVEDYSGLDEIPPTCPECDEVIRPEVVLFQEALPDVALQTLNDQVEQGFDLVFAMGTTASFPYIAWPIIEATKQHKPTVEINPSSSEISAFVDIQMRSGGADTLDAIYSAYLDLVGDQQA